MRTLLGILLIIVALGVAGFVIYRNSRYSSQTRTFSSYSLLNASWDKYKQNFLNPDGRILDHSNHDITTSEGQGYALLRAVWSDDKPTFDLVWKWTKENMKRKDDNLFGWEWGQMDNNQYGFLANGGDNSASDADTDIALALLYASKRWGDTHYQDDALPVIKDIWKYEVDTAASQNYLVAGNWAKGSTDLVINPSYFSPYAWRAFAKADPQDDWASLIDPAYQLLQNSTTQPLDKSSSANLPPNWVVLSKKDASLKQTDKPQLTTDYGYDAVRVPWRIALDAQFYKEPKATQYLTNNFQKLIQDYKTQNKLFSEYTHDGQPLNQNENPVMYATILGVLITTDPKLADQVYQDKVLKLYSNAQDTFDPNLPYYEQNWLWFGAALKENYLTPLYQ